MLFVLSVTNLFFLVLNTKTSVHEIFSCTSLTRNTGQAWLEMKNQTMRIISGILKYVSVSICWSLNYDF